MAFKGLRAVAARCEKRAYVFHSNCHDCRGAAVAVAVAPLVSREWERLSHLAYTLPAIHDQLTGRHDAPHSQPVAQIFRRDAPGPWWPAGIDLLQILRCPNEHWDPPAQQADVSPVLEVRWRRAADVVSPVTTPPSPSRYDEDGYLPQACALTVERVTDFPFREELPAELRPRLAELVRETGDGGDGGDGGDVITRLAGWNLGGWPTWHLTHPTVFPYGDCGTAMTLLFTMASDDETGVAVGRWGDLRIFTCPADHRHAFQVDLH